LIIFDLDDTLIDTSGAVTPFKMKECLSRFINDGLPIPNFEKAYGELLSINAKSYKSKDALVQFLLKFGGDPSLIHGAMEEMSKPLPADFAVPTTPNAKEILKTFANLHTLALVTGGHPPFQMEKLEKAGIDRSVFSNIAIPEDSVKKPFYQRLIREFSVSPEEVLVCGDRIAMDLLPAFELGITTVHMRWGRGRLAETEKWIHHAISDLSELKRIVKT
jgi:FMN phosphatase YigB (HAD superfamily)